MQLTVRDGGDIVVWRKGFKHGDRERDIMFILCIMLMEDERVVEDNDLAINIFDEDKKRFRPAVNLFIPSEVGYDRKVDALPLAACNEVMSKEHPN